MRVEKRKNADESLLEPSIVMAEAFETPENKFRREWAEVGADWAWQVLRFLQGRRINEVSQAEVGQTKTYARSSDLEKKALQFVAEQAEQRRPMSDEDRIQLIRRDDFLMKHVTHEALGRRDWVAEIQNIPAAIQRAHQLDAALFHKTYCTPHLFDWIFERSGSGSNLTSIDCGAF